ncbi:hypothetical protein NXW84_10920 [Bacteroides fragilis]|nr:hypothetical protein M103_1635 [Bacteroides fragilis str. 1007-1-F \
MDRTTVKIEQATEGTPTTNEQPGTNRKETRPQDHKPVYLSVACI